MYNFDSYNVLLAIATNKLVLRMTASVLQGHINARLVPEARCSSSSRVCEAEADL